MNSERQYMIVKILNRLLIKGYSLLEAIDMMKQVHGNIISRMKQKLDEGNLLSHTFKILKFKPFVHDTIQIGEKSNKIQVAFGLLEEQFDFYLKIKKQMNKVLLYPVILFGFALFCFEMIRINLYPIIENLLIEFSIIQNKVLIIISFHLLKWIACILFMIFFILYHKKNLANLVPSIKLYRTIILAKQLVILLSCGNSLEEAFIILQSSLNPKIYNFKHLESALLNDSKLGLSSSYSESFLQYFKLGMKTNDLVNALKDYITIYEEILIDHLTKLSYYIQFGLFSLLSINIFLIYYIVMIPMLQISENI